MTKQIYNYIYIYIYFVGETGPAIVLPGEEEIDG